MELIQKICEMGHAKRKELGIKVRQPLQKLKVKREKLKVNNELIQIIKDELNIKEIEFEEGGDELIVVLDTTITRELQEEGLAREIVREIQQARKVSGTSLDEQVIVHLPSWPKDYEDYIKQEVLASKLVVGNTLDIQRSS